MKYFTYSLSIFLVFATFANVQAAEIKKWTDESGQVYYGDTPPLTATAKTIRTNKRPSNIGTPLPRLNTTSSQKTSTPAQSASPDSLEPEQAKKACEIARKDLKVIKNSNRIQLRAADGSLRYMTNDEIKQRQERSKSDIKKFCQ